MKFTISGKAKNVFRLIELKVKRNPKALVKDLK